MQLYVRRYAPFSQFGGGFEGDNRSVSSTSLTATSRTSGSVFFDRRSIGRATGGSSGTAFVGAGETAAAVFFDNTDTLDLQIYCSAGATKPARGEPITAGGITGYVLNSAITWQSGDFQRMTIRANKWANIS